MEATPGNEAPPPLQLDLMKEGKAEFFKPRNVFYNPVQEFNRDLSIVILNEYIDSGLWKHKRRQSLTDSPEAGLKILESLSATGLRSVRYAKEVNQPDLIRTIHANDLSASAAEVIRKNIEHNGVHAKVEAKNEDATSLMYTSRRAEHAERYDVIDIDPYGSAAPFLDAGVQAIRDAGLLMVTCTDMAVLCGSAGAESCYARYGAVPLHEEFCHEQALRILIKSIDSIAARYGRYVVPLVSVSVDFYIRIFLQVFTGKGKAKDGITNHAMVYQCVGCHAMHFQPLGTKTPNPNVKPPHDGFIYRVARGPPVAEKCKCGGRYTVGGPIYSAPIQNVDFINKVLDSLEATRLTSDLTFHRRIHGMLAVISEELHHIPLYHSSKCIHKVCHAVGLRRRDLNSALLNAGYRVSGTHASSHGFKTDAPIEVLYDIMREWIQMDAARRKTWEDHYGLKEGEVLNGTPPEESDKDGHDTKIDYGRNIYYMTERSGAKISFAPHPQADPDSKAKGLLRFQTEFPANWGPKPKAPIPVKIKQVAETLIFPDECVTHGHGLEEGDEGRVPKKVKQDP